MKGNIKLMKKLFNILLVLLLSMDVFTSNKVVEAEEESFTTKYAVQIYGIEQDVLEDGSTAGLTFGPALGQDFMNAYISHTPSGATASGNPHRCVHDDEWETIVRWNHEDPYVYEECISNNCTHSVELTLSVTLRNSNFVYGGSASGDGVGALYYEMQNYARGWNAWGPYFNGTGNSSNSSVTGGWGASNIRAILNGVDSLITLDTFAEANNITSSEALISAFPTILQSAIGARATLYDSVYNDKAAVNLKTSYDKLWLLSSNEIADNILSDTYNHPLEAPNGKYQKFEEDNIDGLHYNTARKVYAQSGAKTTSSENTDWWLRSLSTDDGNFVIGVDSRGKFYSGSASLQRAITPCFSLNSTYTPSFDPSDPNYDPTLDNGHYISKRGINAYNDWVKNGNVWTYTFDVFDDSIPYYIWEDRIPGYTSSVMKPDKDLMNQNGEKYYEIINRATTLGSLNITKTTNNETEDRFEFTITLNGNGLEGTKVFSNVVFTDGVGKIKLGKDESKLIEGLPAGVTYTVEETHYGDYTTTFTGATGTIVQGETQEVTFNNVLKHVEDLTIETGFKVKKVVDGNNELSETFDFIAQINTGEPNKRIVLSNGETLTSDASGLIVHEFSLANNGELLFSNLSEGATYQVTEKAGEYISSYNIIDANDNGNITQSANENTAQNLALTTAVETLDADERVEITFTNKIIKKQNLKVAKQVNGNAEDKAKQYEITVELYGLDPMATLDSDAGRFVADEDGYAIKTILLRDGEEFMIPEVPVGTQYVITESPNNTYAAYEITDANGGSNFVKNADSNSDVNLRLATQMETVNENEEATVKFINTSQVILKLEKVVDGNMGNKEDEFEFDVKVWKDIPESSSEKLHILSIFTMNDGGSDGVTCDFYGNSQCDHWILILSKKVDNFIFEDVDMNNIEFTYGNDAYAEEVYSTPSREVTEEEILREKHEYDAIAQIFNKDKVIYNGKEYSIIKENVYQEPAGLPGWASVRYTDWFTTKYGADFYINLNENSGYVDLSQYGGVSNGDGSYRFTLKHGDNLEIAKAFPGYNYEITEVDYFNEGYRTYPNDSMIQGRTISGILNANTNAKMRNIRGAAVPTEIRFWWWAGIPLVLGPIAWFIFKKRRQSID